MYLLPWYFAVALAVADEIVVSMLLHRQYTNNRSDWEADGKPRGVFWIPKESKIGAWYATYASGHAGQLSRWRWLVKNPDWLSRDPGAAPLMFLHRMFLSAFLVCGVAPFVIAAVMQ